MLVERGREGRVRLKCCEDRSRGKGGMGFVSLLEVASMPILQVLIISMLGAFMATDYLKLLPPDARKYMNKVCCLLFNLHGYLIFDARVVVVFLLNFSSSFRFRIV